MVGGSDEIVVVEDDDAMRQALERFLRSAGFETVTFPSAEALLQAGNARTAACLVLDVHLPGISGFELRRRLTRSGAGAPVIFITAYDESATREQAQELGAVAYLAKPFPGRRLMDAITQALAGT
jgi:FixJ family two-component response regulator